ncbi:helix-turn-helix transcriptional regulator [Candidatus Parabeggiatoa sp. HSG14]|uniref:helix-turn-helix domain-containing protein n=1 Tax=Candidatus Parabeggiatoa sp. HSG14 TaxID=3055593 RepID=UPI0025A7B90F|nr:helix-turn-helix transcriptional regulator [Thiotrichales bacterium HSG14]
MPNSEYLFMELPQKLKLIRSVKNWTQEEVAEKLGISIHAYAKIERGETDVNFSRLQQIAEVMEIGLSQLFGLDEKNVFNLAGNYNTQGDNWYVNSPSNEQIECKHELEKANLRIEEREKEIDYLKQQVSDLRKIIDLLKKEE